MINEAFIVGKVTKATERNEGKVLDLLVEYKRYYGYGDNAGFSVNTHNVYLVSNTETTKSFIQNSNSAKKPVYIGVYGMLRERTLDPVKEGEEYGPSQVYVLGTKVLQLSNDIETSECRAYFQGKVRWKDTKYNSKGTPMTKLIVSSEKARKNKDGEAYTDYTGVMVTVFREGLEVPFEKGDIAMFAGTLDSYELRDYPGVYTSNLTSFDYLGAPVSRIQDNELMAPDSGVEVSMEKESTPRMENSVQDDDTSLDIDLPF